MSPIVDGASFVLDAPKDVPALWGSGTQVLWAYGEALLLCGPPGVGKSTLIQQVIRARMGFGDGNVLGFPVEADSSRRVLYVAGDRPSQIARSLGRMFREEDRRDLSHRLVVDRAPSWQLHTDPARLRDLALEQSAGTVVIDSLKDLASPLTDDGVATTVKHALTACTEVGIQVCALHHQRKANGENKKPTKLDDVYGSTWLTAGAGSVLLLHGQAGDPVVEMLHLKQPADEVGPLTIVHDHTIGTSRVSGQVDVMDVLSPVVRLTVKDVAAQLYGADPSANQIEKARRKLTDLTGREMAVKHPGETSTRRSPTPAARGGKAARVKRVRLA